MAALVQRLYVFYAYRLKRTMILYVGRVTTFILKVVHYSARDSDNTFISILLLQIYKLKNYLTDFKNSFTR